MLLVFAAVIVAGTFCLGNFRFSFVLAFIDDYDAKNPAACVSSAISDNPPCEASSSLEFRFLSFNRLVG